MEPNQTEQAAKPDNQTQAHTIKAFPLKWLVLVVAAIVIAVPGIAALWMVWQQQPQHSAIESRLEALSDLQTQADGLASDQRQLNNQLDDIEQKQLEQGDVLTNLQNQSPLSSEEIKLEWALEEINYLLNLANQRALLANDVEGALLALSMADQQVREIGDYRLQPLREKIANEELALKTVKDTDLAGITADMMGLISSVDKLQVVTGPKMVDQRKNDAPISEHPAWKQAASELWTQLRSLVIIRQQEDAPAAVLMPEQRYFIYQNLRLKLETARFAAVSGDQEMFEQSLQSAIDWLKRYFVGDHRDAMLETLQNMQQLAISIEIPDISGSLRWLKGFEP